MCCNSFSSFCKHWVRVIDTFCEKCYVGNCVSDDMHAQDVFHLFMLMRKNILEFTYMFCMMKTLCSSLVYWEFWYVCTVCSQIRCLKGQRGLPDCTNFDRIHIVNHYRRDDESSDEDGVKLPLSMNPCRGGSRITLRPQLGDTDSEADEDGESLRLMVPSNSSHKSTTVWPPTLTHTHQTAACGEVTPESSSSHPDLKLPSASVLEILKSSVQTENQDFYSHLPYSFCFCQNEPDVYITELVFAIWQEIQWLVVLFKATLDWSKYWKSLRLYRLFYTMLPEMNRFEWYSILCFMIKHHSSNFNFYNFFFLQNNQNPTVCIRGCLSH